MKSCLSAEGFVFLVAGFAGAALVTTGFLLLGMEGLLLTGLLLDPLGDGTVLVGTTFATGLLLTTGWEIFAAGLAADFTAFTAGLIALAASFATGFAGAFFVTVLTGAAFALGFAAGFAFATTLGLATGLAAGLSVFAAGLAGAFFVTVLTGAAFALGFAAGFAFATALDLAAGLAGAFFTAVFGAAAFFATGLAGVLPVDFCALAALVFAGILSAPVLGCALAS